MLMIIAVHSIYLIADSTPRQYEFLQVMLLNSSVYFLFISGFLFQYLIHNFKYSGFIFKKLEYVLIPYVIVSIPAIYLIISKSGYLPHSWIASGPFLEKPLLIQILLYYITGAHMPHFWFIPMIFIFYLFSIIFYYIDKYPKYYLVIPLLLVVSFCIQRPPMNDNVLQSFVFFLPIYLLGMCSSHYFCTLTVNIHRNLFILFALAVGLTFWSFFNQEVNFLQKIVLSFLIIIFFYQYHSRVVDAFLNPVSKYSFSIFFIHKYVLILMVYLINKLSFNPLFESGFLGILILIIINVLICIAFIRFMKLVFGKYSRLLIGS